MLKNRMLKRSIGVLIAGMALGAQAGLATAGESDLPLGAQQLRANAEPAAKTTYQAEHAGTQAAVRNDFPRDAQELRVNSEPPVRNTYQAEHPVTAD